jgi:two-component system, response regulator YesN
MKKWFSRSAMSNIGRYRLRILFAILIFSSLTTILATLVVSRIYSSEITGELTNALSIASGSDSQYIGLINNEVSYLLLDLNNDPTTINFLNMQTDDPMVEYNLARRLRNVKNVYPFIQSIVLYNGMDDRLISTDLNPGSTGNFGDQALSATLSGEFRNRITVIPRKSADAGNLITYILVTPRPGQKTAESALVVNIYESTFSSMNPSSGENGSMSFIVDQNGVVVSHTDKNEISKDYSGFSFLHGILANSNESGTGPCTLNGGDYVYSYSTVSDINWKLVSLVPMKNVLAKPAEIQGRIIFIAGAILLISIILSGFISEFVYRPVSKLLSTISSDMESPKYSSRMDEIDYISKTYNDIVEKSNALLSQNQMNADLLRNEFLKSLLTDDLNPVYVRKQIDAFNILPGCTCFYLILMEIDRYYSIREDYAASNHETGIFEIIRSVFSEYKDCLILPISTWRFCVVCGSADGREGQAGGQIAGRLEKVQATVEAVFGYSVSIVTGDCLPDIAATGNAYRQTVQLMKYKTLLGLGSIISADIIEGHITAHGPLPEEMEAGIVSSLNSGRRAEYQEKIGKFLEEASRHNYEDFRSIIMEAGISCIKQIEKIGQDGSTGKMQNANLSMEKLLYIESIDEIRQWFLDVFNQHQLQTNDIRIMKNMSDNTQKLIEKALEYIHRNYMKGDLSVESVADHIGYSPNYFSKAFKKMTGTKVIDYLSEVRIAEAKRLLKETEMNVAEVAVCSGFININYFYFAFKKAVGMTPDNYRFLAKL